MPVISINKTDYKITEGNIEKIFKQATQSEITEGLNWYKDANKFAQSVSNETKKEISIEHVAGVTSALSIRNKWDRNKIDAKNLILAYYRLKKVSDISVCTFTSNKHKAVNILESNANQIETILSGLKTQNFKRNILGCKESVTIDGHAFCISAGIVNALKKVPSISAKNYKIISDEYRQATKMINKKYNLNLIPSQLQAITWVTYKRLHNK